jgi:hypothetical protein
VKIVNPAPASAAARIRCMVFHPAMFSLPAPAVDLRTFEWRLPRQTEQAWQTLPTSERCRSGDFAGLADNH